MLYIIRGLPGSGKSTYAKSLGCFHVEADMYFMKDGVYQFDGDKIGQSHMWCNCTVDDSLFNNVDVAVSNTFTRKWEVQPYIDMAGFYGIPYKIITLDNDFGNIHNVPADVFQKMKARWETIEGEEIIKYPIDK